MNTEFGTRLKQARQHAGLTQIQLSKLVGVSQGTLSELEKIAYGSAYSYQLAKYCGVSPQWLTEGVGSMITHSIQEPQATYAIDLKDNPAYPAVRRVKFKLSASISGFAVEYDEGNSTPLVFNRTWYDNNNYTPTKLFAVSVCNGSMEPGLHHNDVVIVNTESTTPKDGKVFAVNYEGEMVIKRLIRDAGQWWLSSDNADQRRYPRKACDENCLIIGEIIHKQSETI